jgi:hypothetical protein
VKAVRIELRPMRTLQSLLFIIEWQFHHLLNWKRICERCLNSERFLCSENHGGSRGFDVTTEAREQQRISFRVGKRIIHQTGFVLRSLTHDSCFDSKRKRSKTAMSSIKGNDHGMRILNESRSVILASEK